MQLGSKAYAAFFSKNKQQKQLENPVLMLIILIMAW